MSDRLVEIGLTMLLGGVAAFLGLILYFSAPLIVATWAMGWDCRIGMIAVTLIFVGLVLVVTGMGAPPWYRLPVPPPPPPPRSRPWFSR